MEDYIIGLIWATGSVCGESLIVRNKDFRVISLVAKYIGRSCRDGQRKIKIAMTHPLVARLSAVGWRGRMDTDRGVPHGDIEMLLWAAGYCSVRAHVDASGKRLRIRGSLNIVTSLTNDILPELGLYPKKPTICLTNEGQTWEIYYQSAKEIKRFLGWQHDVQYRLSCNLGKHNHVTMP